MNPGKALAQAQHAGTQLLKYSKHPDVQAYLAEGNKEGANSFSTTITLGVTIDQLLDIIGTAQENHYLAEEVLDPSYPFWVDVEIANLISTRTDLEDKIEKVKEEGTRALLIRTEVTCGWILGSKDDVNFTSLVKNLKLHI